MGYYINQEEAEFFISKDNLDRCLDAVKGLMWEKEKMNGGSWSGGVQIDRWFPWVNTENVLSARSLMDALDAWRWETSTDNEGNIVDIHFRGEKSGSDEHLMKVIAPFVKCGSYIQMRGEEGEIWRWIFSRGKVQEKYAKISWE